MADFGFHDSANRWDYRRWSLALGRIAGIQIRIHLFFIIFVAFELLRGAAKEQLPLEMTFCGVLFVLVLLHELGHCFACRAVGGEADEILMWPLGGLAYVHPPNRPADHLITTLAGPAVNLVVCIFLLPALAYFDAASWSLLNPFGGLVQHESFAVMALTNAFIVSYVLLLFNLLPIFPFDGGRVLQGILWLNGSLQRATSISVVVGMIGSGLLGAVSLFLAGRFGVEYFLLTAIAGFAFFECLRTYRRHEAMGEIPENEFGYDFSQGYASLERSMPELTRARRTRSLRQRWRDWIQRRRERQQANLEAEVDRILAKIHTSGIESLSRVERKKLELASKRRQR